jgi:hypothetical protein
MDRVPGPPPVDLAEQYLKDRDKKLLFWRNGYYEHTGTHHREQPEGDLKADIVRFLQTSKNRRNAERARGRSAMQPPGRCGLSPPM